jgi:hypothetical protein
MRTRISTTLLMAMLAVCVLLAGCGGSPHPKEVAGTWTTSQGTTVTFAPQGGVVLNGQGNMPSFLARLHALGTWETAGGRLKLTSNDPGARASTEEFEYTMQSGGKTLRISTPGGGQSWELQRTE